MALIPSARASSRTSIPILGLHTTSTTSIARAGHSPRELNSAGGIDLPGELTRWTSLPCARSRSVMRCTTGFFTVTHHRPPLFGQHAGPGRHRHARHAHRPHRERSCAGQRRRRRKLGVFDRKYFLFEQRPLAHPLTRHLLVRAQSAPRVRLSSPCGVRSRRARGARLLFRDEVRGPVDVRVPHSIARLFQPRHVDDPSASAFARARRHRTAGAWTATASPRRRTARRYRGIPSPARTRRLEKTRRSPLRRASARLHRPTVRPSRRDARRLRGGRSTTEAARRSKPRTTTGVMARATRGSTARYRSTRSLSRSSLGSTNPSARTCSMWPCFWSAAPRGAGADALISGTSRSSRSAACCFAAPAVP